MSQYRSHGYLFNRGFRVEAEFAYLSQYRSHGYLFNPFHGEMKADFKLSQYRSHGYLFNHKDQTLEVSLSVSIPFSRLSL